MQRLVFLRLSFTLQRGARSDVKLMSREELELEVEQLREWCNWLEREREAETALKLNLSRQLLETKNKIGSSKAKLRDTVEETLAALQVSTCVSTLFLM